MSFLGACRKNKHGVSRSILDKLLDRFEHRVTLDSIMTSVPPIFSPSDPPNMQGTLSQDPPTLKVVESSKNTSKGSVERSLTPIGSPKQNCRHISDHKEKVGLENLPNRRSVDSGCGDGGAGPLDVRCGRGKGGGVGPVDGKSGRADVPSSAHSGTGSGVMPNRKDSADPVPSFHDNKDTAKEQQDTKGGVRSEVGKKSKKKAPVFNKAPRFVKNEEEEGVVTEVKGETTGDGSSVKAGFKGVAEDIATMKTVTMETVTVRVASKDNVTIDTPHGKGGVGVIGEGRKVKNTVAKSANVAEVDEDMTNDQWDSSEEVDLLEEEDEGVGGDEEEGEDEGEGEEVVMDASKEETQHETEDGAKDTDDEVASGLASGLVMGLAVKMIGTGSLSSLSPSEGGSGDREGDPEDTPHVWKPSKDFPCIGMKRSKYSPALRGALADTLHPKYQLEGEVDERNFPLGYQRLLVKQLVAQHRGICALAEDQLNPKRQDFVSMLCLLERSKVDGCHSYLPDVVVEQVFKDRPLMPSLHSKVRSVLGETGMGLLDNNYWNQTPKRQSHLLKIAAAASARSKEAESDVVVAMGSSHDLCEDDPAIVTMSAESANILAESAKTVVGVAPISIEDPSILQISQTLATAKTKPVPVKSSAVDNVYDSEDPLPKKDLPTVFPSALPSNSYAGGQDKLGDLFAGAGGSGLGAVSAKRSPALDKLQTPQSPTAALWGGGQRSSDVGVTKGCGLHMSAIVSSSDRHLRSHDSNVKSCDSGVKSHDFAEKFSLQQLMASSKDAHLADSGINAVLEVGSNVIEENQFRSKSGHVDKSRYGDDEGGPLCSSPAPSLEKWVWQERPTSAESWPESWSDRDTDDHNTADSTTTAIFADSATTSFADSAIASTTMHPAPEQTLFIDTHSPLDLPGSQITPSPLNLPGPLDPPGSQVNPSPLNLPGGELGTLDPPGSRLAKTTEDTDLAFLVECFPDLEEPYLQQLLLCNHGDVEGALSMALLSVTSTPLSPVQSHAYFGYDYGMESQESVSSSEDHVKENSSTSLDQSKSADDADNTANDGEIARALQDGMDDNVGGFSAHVRVGTEGVDAHDEDMLYLEDDVVPVDDTDDEEIARLLQEELDQEGGAYDDAWPDVGGLHLESSVRDQPLDPEKHRVGVAREDGGVMGSEFDGEDDDNLVLKLTPSLALQLQLLFGSIEDRLPIKGM